MITIAIQAGGVSSRMGQDKALLPFLGQPLILRIVQRVSSLADEIIITTNSPEHYKFLGLPLYPDIIPERGALGGLYTALYFARFPLVAVIACDMPFVNKSLLAVLCTHLEETNGDIIMPQTESGFEPLHAVYRKETCLPAVKAALDNGEWRLNSWLSSVKVIQFSQDEILLYDPERKAFLNLNTPEEFQKAEEMAKED
jgi:molybdopterin-guanine dinucleotide biosynthesis protein A